MDKKQKQKQKQNKKQNNKQTKNRYSYFINQNK